VKTRRKKGHGDAAQIYRHPLVDAMNPYLACLEDVADPSTKSVRWTPKAATLTGVLMALSSHRTMAGRCHDALACLENDALNCGLPGSYNGLAKALLRQQDTVLPVLKANLKRHAKEAFEEVPKTSGWTLLAIDGSKADLPRTLSHEEHFGIADNGKCPQAFITAIVEVNTKLLWDWRIDKGRASEKHHLVEMAGELPDGCLLLADGNFVGYSVWRALQGHDFLIRVGGNVHLISQLWPEARIERHGDIVYAWPGKLQTKCGPLILRLIKIGRGNKAMYLLTNVLNRQRLSDRTAGKIYRLRWGAEMFYRAFKRTLGYVKLKSKAGERGQVELNLALVACSIMVLLGIKATGKARRDAPRLSPAGLLDVLRDSLLRDTDGRNDLKNLVERLSVCLKDCYTRKRPKASRHRPRTTNTPRHHVLKPPKIRKATAQERELARENYSKLAA
jgi:hypothetical protein